MHIKSQPEAKKRKIRILFFNKFWNHEFPDFSKMDFPDFDIITEEEYKYLALAGDRHVDVVIFHAPSLSLTDEKLLALKSEKGPLWVYWSVECVDHFPRFKNPAIKSLFDITFTYELDADVSSPYVNGLMPEMWREEPKVKTAFVNAFFTSSWDKSGRYDCLKEIMSYLDIHSFGKICNNRQLVEDPYSKGGMVTQDSLSFKKEFISKYKFTLAFENAIAKDYVTEKFFHPLQAGSVPVYLGAPNVDEFAPGEQCYINVNSFESVRALADYLLLLDRDDERYGQYMQWKKKPFKSEFQSKLTGNIEPLHQLFAVVKRKLNLA